MSYSPLDLNLFAWYDAASITGLSDADPVSTWPDSGPNGYHLTQTLTARPTYRTNAINTSLPVVDFDGSNDVMKNMSINASTSRSSLAFALVIKLDTNKTYNGLVSIDSNGSYPAKGLHVYIDSAGRLFWGYEPVATQYYLVAKRTLTTATWYILTGCFGDQTRAFRVTGVNYGVAGGTVVEPSTDCPDVSITGGNITLGRFDYSSDFLDGCIAEAIFFDAVDEADLIFSEGYLSHKYGIALPSTHLFYSAPPTHPPGISGGGVRNVNVRGGADQ